jgi:DNA polymerase-3 subunit gamma/tau
MAWICGQEGIEADAEALAILAAAGEGSVRDSLSALDQAIACCGAKLVAAEVRALLGAFSLESLEKVTFALAAGDSRSMLEVVDELERNGQNLQHFSRELSRYFRNLLVTRVAGADTRLVAASAAQREKLAAIAAGFSEEDLTRYLQLSLDLFKDLQYSLQPRFHLEIGLVRLVQAGRLLPIEQALAGLGPGPGPGPGLSQVSRTGSAAAPAPRMAPPPAAAPAQSAPRAMVPPRAPGPSPFELDRAKKAGTRPPEPQSSGANALAPAAEAPPMTAGDPRARLHAYLHEKGNAHLADAVENASIAVVGGDLNVVAPKSYALYFKDPGFDRAVSEVFGRPLRLKLTTPEAGAGPQAVSLAAPPKNEAEDEVTGRALSHPEVRRFREVFGGEVRKVRNLKE